MIYSFVSIPQSEIPAAANPLWQHAIDTYASETNKVASVWREFSSEQLAFRPHPRSSTAGDIMRHQLLSERRFFGEFLGTPEPSASDVLPREQTREAFTHRLVELASARLRFLATQTDAWWLETAPFFDVRRQRVWIFWRRLLHTAHHRTQLTVYLRLLEKPVVSTYGPTADLTWEGADPTLTVASAERKSGV